MNVALTINVLAILNLILIAFILYTRSEGSLSNRLLTLVLIVSAFYNLRHFAELVGFWHIVSLLLFPTQIAVIFFGPIIYAYVHIKLGDKHWRHPVLFLFSILLLVYLLFLGFQYTFFLSGSEKQEYVYQIHLGNSPDLYLIYEVISILLHLCYLTFSFIWVFGIVRNCKYATDSEKQKVRFVFHFIILNIILLFFLPLSYVYLNIHQIDTYSLPLTGISVYLFVFYKMFQYPLVFGFRSDRQFQAVSVNSDIKSALKGDNRSEVLKNGINTEVLDEIFSDLIRYMEAEKPYLDPNLSLKALSDHLSICTHKLSLVINEKSGENFFNYINSYRITEAKRLLGDTKTKSFNIEDIAFMSGFNSRASFYNAFKKHVNKTPTVYLSELKSNNYE